MTLRIHVAAAVILAADQRILIARRPEHKHHRELHEELAISVQSAEPFIEVQHDYADKAVLLEVWWVRAFSGQPQGNEGQPLQWVTVAELADYAFPAANQPIIDALQSALQPN